MSDEILYKNISELRNMLDKEIISSVELTQEFLNRSKKINPEINSVISHTEEYAMKSA